MKIRAFIYLLFLLSICSCEEKTDWDIQTGPTDALVIDAMITNEYKYQTVRLTRPFPDPNGQAVPVTGADVAVTMDDAVLSFVEEPGYPGTYSSKIKVAGTIDKQYTLVVRYEDQVFNAQTTMIPVIPSWPLVIVPVDGSDTMRTLEWIAPEYKPEDLAMYQVDIDWSHLVEPGSGDTLTYARLFRYTLNTIDVNYVIFPQDKEEVYFPVGSILIARKFSVTEDYGNYLRALLSETEWQGSLFEEIRGNLPTNISNGGLGYFSACSVVADTIVVK
jgi:hypothetical protein